MARMKCLELSITTVVSILITMAVLVACAGIVLVAYLRNDVTPELFYPTGIYVALYGMIEVTGGYIHLVAISGINKKTGFWTGRKILIFSLLLTIFLIIYDLYALYVAYTYYDDLDQASDESNPTSYSKVELKLAQKFNEMFFQAGYLCNGSDGVWFWQLVQEQCPAIMSQHYCTSCPLGGIRFCPADELTCLQSGNVGSTCPYNMCRENMLPFVAKWIAGPFLTVPALFLILHFINLVMSCPYTCYENKAKATLKVVPVADESQHNEEKAKKEMDPKIKPGHAPPPPVSQSGSSHAHTGNSVHQISKSAHKYEPVPEVVDLEKDGKKKTATHQGTVGIEDLGPFIDVDYLMDRDRAPTSDVELGGYSNKQNSRSSPYVINENPYSPVPHKDADDFDIDHHLAIFHAIHQQEQAMKESRDERDGSSGRNTSSRGVTYEI